MAASNWTFLTGVLTSDEVKRGVTAGTTKPAGGGDFVYGFNSQEIVDGVVALHANQVNFAPMLKGGSISAAIKRGVSGGPVGFAPFVFLGLQSGAVGASGYLLGLSDGDPHRIVLRKGVLTGGIPDSVEDPTGSDGILMRSVESFVADTWVHVRLDVILQGSGDVILRCFRNDLDSNDVDAPVWVEIPGMEGPQSPAIAGFVDDALGVNTGSAPHTSGRGGFGCRFEDVSRRAYVDEITLARQL